MVDLFSTDTAKPSHMNPIDPTRLSEALTRHPLKSASAGPGCHVEYIEAGSVDAPVSHVLLHGIGSSAASWIAQLEAAHTTHTTPPAHILAWNAPGYGTSTALAESQPLAKHYATRLWQWLDASGVNHPFTLVGQSMGCLIAVAAAAQRPDRISRLVLFAPARGYGKANDDERTRRRDERLAALREHGPEGLAEKRGAAMLSPSAHPAMINYLRNIMRRVNPAGYTQATHMLAQSDIDSDLVGWTKPLVVASGNADGITPQASCMDIAARAGVAWTDLGAVGHGCPLEASVEANQILGLT